MEQITKYVPTLAFRDITASIRRMGDDAVSRKEAKQIFHDRFDALALSTLIKIRYSSSGYKFKNLKQIEVDFKVSRYMAKRLLQLFETQTAFFRYYKEKGIVVAKNIKKVYQRKNYTKHNKPYEFYNRVAVKIDRDCDYSTVRRMLQEESMLNIIAVSQRHNERLDNLNAEPKGLKRAYVSLNTFVKAVGWCMNTCKKVLDRAKNLDIQCAGIRPAYEGETPTFVHEGQPYVSASRSYMILSHELLRCFQHHIVGYNKTAGKKATVVQTARSIVSINNQLISNGVCLSAQEL